jgi:NDP-sugar pyrophosphorylase family protein
MSKKAIILAGGRGERMIPITNTIPKALVPIDGIPILVMINKIDTMSEIDN